MAKQVCPECGVRFEPEHPLAMFCSKPHKIAWMNRNYSEGGPLLVLAKAWRKSRHLKGDPIGAFAMGEFCIALDRLIAEDKAAGRADPVEVLKSRLRRQGINIAKPEPKAKAPIKAVAA
jgi:hypothetical protein